MNHWDKFIFVTDNHGDQADIKACNAMFKFLDIWKPTLRIHGGDCFDFRPLRRKASEEERQQKMRGDFDAGMDFLEKFKPTHFLLGNHDKRLFDLAESNHGLMSEYAGSLVEEIYSLLSPMKTKILPYDRREGVLRIGKLKLIHGYAHGVTAARRAAQAYGSVLMGHAHSIQSSSIEGLDNRVGRIVGCLCDLDMDYSYATMASLVHRHGFAYGVVNRKSGEYHTFQAESINGTWIFPSDVMVIRQCSVG